MAILPFFYVSYDISTCLFEKIWYNKLYKSYKSYKLYYKEVNHRENTKREICLDSYGWGKRSDRNTETGTGNI